MCGIFGIVSSQLPRPAHIRALALRSERRGKDSSGLVKHVDGRYEVLRSDHRLTRLLKHFSIGDSRIVMGHSRLVTNGTDDNQPVIRDGVIIVHNGIVVNADDIWPQLGATPQLGVDTEVIAAIIALHVEKTGGVEGAEQRVFELCDGILSCLCLVPSLGKLFAFTNNSSLFSGVLGGDKFFASEAATLRQLGCDDVSVLDEPIVLDVPVSNDEVAERDMTRRTRDLVPSLVIEGADAALLVDEVPDLQRCTRCILPHTFPYITFDHE